MLARGEIDLGGADAARDDTTDDALAAFGLRRIERAQVEDDAFWLWPCNVESFRAWMRVQTQWRVGMAGATGLDYSGVQAALRLDGIRRSAWPRIFADIQDMEGAWLEEAARKRGRR